MPDEALLEGITSKTIETPRLKMRVLESGPENGVPVVFIHGNCAAARFWEETMLALPEGYRGIAPDLRGYGETEALGIDATRGLRDWSDDVKALTDTLGLRQIHLVGWSMGAGVCMQYAIDHPAEVLSLTLESPLSPFGFGATKDAQGTPTTSDFAGSGGGTVNQDFVRLLKEGDRGSDSPVSPRNTMNSFYFKPPFHPAPEREEVFVTEVLSTRIGEDFYPGDLTTSEKWPGVAPGVKGINNAMAPNWCNLSALVDISPKPPILWIRGDSDQIVSDTSFFDLAFLGQLGAVPGWPGADACPPQPMVSQTRFVFDRYQEAAGAYWEKVLADCGHSPHVEKPEEFNSLLAAHLGYSVR